MTLKSRIGRSAAATAAIACGVVLSGAAIAQPPAPLEGAPPPLPAGPDGARRITLDGALALAARNNFDLKAARTRLDQAAVNVELAWAALLPNAALQGKYTHNYKEVVLDFSQFVASGAAVSAAQGKLATDAFTDLYTKLGQAPSAQVLSDQQALAAAVKAQLGQPTQAPAVIQKGEQLDASLTATVPLVVPWAWFQLSSAKKGAAAAESGFEVTRAGIMLAVAQAFYLAASSDEVASARHHGIEVAKKTLDDARVKVDAGTANRVELTRAQVAYERAMQGAEESEATRDQAYRGLATAIGLGGPFEVDAGPLPSGVAGDRAELARMALTLRPEFTQSQRTTLSNDETARSNLYRWAPTLSGFGNVRAFNYAGFSGDNYAWAVGLQLDWLIYDGGVRDAQRHLALAQNAEQAARLESLRLTVRDDVENAHRNVGVRQRALATATHAVQLSRETLDLVRVQHDAGTATQLDLLTAQDQLINSELLLAQARFDLALADITLRKQVGTFPPPQSAGPN